VASKDKDKNTAQPAEPSDPKTETDQIQTSEQLKAAYPELIQEILDEQKVGLEEFFSNRTAAEIKSHFPQLFERIIATVSKGALVDLRTPGFLLAIGDPFAAGTLRTFMHLVERSGLQLPFVLPFKDKNSAAAIQSYIVRAEGGGDLDRAKLAKEALAKCKKK